MVAQLGLRAVECQTHSEGWTSIDPTEEQMALRKKDIIRQVDEAFTGSQVHRFTGSQVHGFTGSRVHVGAADEGLVYPWISLQLYSRP
jgi:hypothetical protein